MTFTNKLLTYLGFCPSKESAKHFRSRDNTLSTRTQYWKPRNIKFIGVLLIFAGLMPFYFEDTSIAGVTDTIILHSRLGLASFTLGVILLVLGVIIPRIKTKLRMRIVEEDCL